MYWGIDSVYILLYNSINVVYYDNFYQLHPRQAYAFSGSDPSMSMVERNKKGTYMIVSVKVSFLFSYALVESL